MFRFLNSQKQILFEQISYSGLNPNDFEPETFKEHSGNTGEGLRYKGTEFYFAIFDIQDRFSSMDRFWVSLSPGEHAIVEQTTCIDFQSIIYDFQKYLQLLMRELTAKDPWADAKEFVDTILSLPEAKAPKGEIPKVELQAIWTALSEVQSTLLRSIEDDGRKHKYIKDQLRILRDAGEHMGKKDYFLLIYSTVAGLCATLAVTPETLHNVGKILCGALNTILHLH